MRLRLFGLMVLRGSVFGSVWPYVSILLLRAGLPLGLLGPVSGVAAVISLVAAPWWGRRGDRLGRRRMFALAMVAAAPIMLAFATGSLPVTLAASLIWAAISSAYVPLGDSLTLDRLGGSRSEYARLRVGASTGYIATVVLVGALVSLSGLGWSAPGIVGAILALVTGGLLAIHLGGELRTGRGVAWVPAGTPPTPGFDAPPGPLEQIRRHAGFVFGMVLIFGAVNAPSIFVGPRIADLGGDGLEIALAIAAGTICEIPAYLTVAAVLRWIGARRTFALGVLVLTVSGLTSAIAPVPGLVIAARLLFGVGYAWTVLPSLAAIAAAGGPRERASLTGLHFATSAAGTVALAVVGLPLVHGGEGSGAILAVTALLAPVGAVAAMLGWPTPYRAITSPEVEEATLAFESEAAGSV